MNDSQVIYLRCFNCRDYIVPNIVTNGERGRIWNEGFRGPPPGLADKTKGKLSKPVTRMMYSLTLLNIGYHYNTLFEYIYGNFSSVSMFRKLCRVVLIPPPEQLPLLLCGRPYAQCREMRPVDLGDITFIVVIRIFVH